MIDGAPYLRSAFGPGAWWYRHVRSGRSVAFALGDGRMAEQDRAAALGLPRVAVSSRPVPADDPVQEAIDAALARK